VGLCTELFYAIIPTLFLCFLLIWYPYIHLVTFLMFFILVNIQESSLLNHIVTCQHIHLSTHFIQRSYNTRVAAYRKQNFNKNFKKNLTRGNNLNNIIKRHNMRKYPKLVYIRSSAKELT